MHTSLSRSAAAKTVHPQAGVAPCLAGGGSIITNTAQRPSRLHPSVASVAHSVSGTVTVIIPSSSRAARLRTRQQPGLAGEAQHALAARAHPVQAQARPHLSVPLAEERAGPKRTVLKPSAAAARPP